MPTMYDRLGDKLGDFHINVYTIQAELQEWGSEIKNKNIILRNFPERVDEDIKIRGKNMIRDSLKLKKICRKNG